MKRPSKPRRARTLAIAASALANNGRVAVVDHATPEKGLVAKSMFRFVHAFDRAIDGRRSMG